MGERMKSDLISRQAAIEVIDAVFPVDPMKSEYAQGIACGAALAKTYIEQLPSAQPEPQWIPCSERLPEEKDAGILKRLGINKRSDYVIATVDVKGERKTVTACTYDGKWGWNMKHVFPDYKIIAWMPLPEPYEEKR